MKREALRKHCLSLKGAFEDFPFGEEVAVYKVRSKMFALLPINSTPLTISLKCDPTEAELLREKYPAVVPGYHLSKRHWNTVMIDGTIAGEEILSMIDDSYALVVKSLTKKEREALAKE